VQWRPDGIRADPGVSAQQAYHEQRGFNHESLNSQLGVVEAVVQQHLYREGGSQCHGRHGGAHALVQIR